MRAREWFRYTNSAGTPRTSNISAQNSGTVASEDALSVSESRSNRMPLTMKKIGMATPNPIARNFGSTASR